MLFYENTVMMMGTDISAQVAITKAGINPEFRECKTQSPVETVFTASIRGSEGAPPVAGINFI